MVSKMTTRAKQPIFYNGFLANILTKYVTFKKSIGYDYNAEAKHFMRLDTFSKNFELAPNTLTQELVLAWIKRRPNEKQLTQLKRANAIKQLAYYMRERGYEAYICPHAVNRPKQPYIPYIFTNDQMKLLLNLADSYPEANTSRNLNLTIPLVFRLLYGCGLRASEILNLKIEDVDTKNALLYISKSKFGKSRVIPMAQSLSLRCEQYKQKTCISSTETDYFIKNPKGSKYDNQSIYHWFRHLLRQAGIPHRGKGQGPRVHDIRHTFAVHSLRKWALAGNDFKTMLPTLSNYMGHCDLRGTQIYLRLTSEMYPTIIDTMSEFFSNMEEH